MNSIKNILKYLVNILDNAPQKHNNTTMAWQILEKVTGFNNIEIILNPDYKLSNQQIEKINQILKEHIEHSKPLQYILNNVYFNNLKIDVMPPILIPRPETQYWCESLANKLIKFHDHKLNILDLCTGTGCIGIYFASLFKNSTIYATDIDQNAINLAKQNAKNNNIKNIVFIKSDLLDNINKNLKFDLILSNPPYLSEEEWRQCDNIVKDWENKIALTAKDDGLYFIKKIIKLSQTWINKDNNIPINLAIEYGDTQTQKIITFIKEEKFKFNVNIIKDLSDKDRCLWINFL